MDKFEDLNLGEFDRLLRSKWQEKASESLKANLTRNMDEGKLVAFYNSRADITRLIEAEGN